MEDLKIWYVVNSKQPWKTIKAVHAQVIGGDKTSYILWDDPKGKTHKNIVGSTAFPHPTGAIASQNFRCHKFLMGYMKCTNRSNWRVMGFIKEMCEQTLSDNMKAMRKNYGSR
ncbi:MAG TPA: hypothetical protein VFM18_04385 [Methanosarcina sp.]|nr:hypothetical protein [Methanosarcina sp.]